MKVREQVQLIHNGQRMRIVKAGNVVFDGFAHLVNGTSGSIEAAGLSGEEQVEGVAIHTEIRHKNWEELGLEEPIKKEELPDYVMKDLQVKIYMDLRIKE